jgi:hypothetical protein
LFFAFHLYLFVNRINNILNIQFSDQYRHTRGSLTEKIKNAVYQVFAQKNLPTIKSIGGWVEWKKLPVTEWAFEHLDDPINPGEDSKTYIEAIMDKVFPNGSPSNDSTTFTMAVVSLFLDPHSGTVEMNEGIVTPKMITYLVSAILTCEFSLTTILTLFFDFRMNLMMI